MAKLNVLVYDGSGVAAASRDNLVRALRAFLAHRYDVQLVSPRQIKDEPWTNNCALLVFPGGRDLPYLFDLAPKGNRRIREWVEQGGRYLGICAGAYYACDRIEFEVGTALEVTGDRELAFFPGVCRGTVFPGFQYDSDNGARECDLALNRAAWRDHWPQSPEACEVWYNGGGAFFPSDPSSSSSSSSSSRPYEVLAAYSQVEGSPAAGVLCHVGKGKAVLWGTHPEHSSPDGADPALCEAKERARLNLVRGTLSALDLEVSDAPAPPPRLLPLFLASDDPAAVQQAAEALAGVAQPSGSAEASIADRHDTFVLHGADAAPQLLHRARNPDTPPPEEPEQLQQELKHICVCDEALPGAALTPLFDLRLYFATLRQVQPAPSVGQVVLYGEVVTSTQTMLDKNDTFLKALPSGLACVASHQVAGRGRGGNSWISPAGCLQFSLVARLPSTSAARIVFVQYLFGVAVVEAVRAVPGYERLGVCLKWPNDIYADMGEEGEGMERYRKIGGILVNSSFAGGEFSLVIGCGINTSNPRPTTSLNELVALHNARHGTSLPLFRPETLLALVLARFGSMWDTFAREGFEPFMDRYLASWIHSNQIVTLDTVSPSQQVRILGLTADHGLLRTAPVVLDRAGREVFGAGGAGAGAQAFVDLQPDGNRFDIMRGLIYARGPA